MSKRRIMTAEEFDHCCLDLERLSYEIICNKRPEYTKGSKNVLANFDKATSDYNIHPYVYCMMLLDKQYDAIKSDLILGIKNSEPMEQRFGDMFNFVKILWCLHVRECFPDKSIVEDEKDPRDVHSGTPEIVNA